MKWNIFVISTSVLVVGLLIGFSLTVNADSLAPNEKVINYCNTVINLQSFPDYVFLTIDYGDGGVISIALTKSNDCFGPGKHEHIDIVAVKKVNFNSRILSQLQNDIKDKTSANYYTESENKIADYLKQVQAMTTKADFVDTYQVVPKNNTLASVDVIWQIIKLDDANFILQKSKLVSKYTNGTIKEEIVDQSKPEHQIILLAPVSPAPIPYELDWWLDWWAENFLYIVFPGAALLLIIIFLLTRKFKKS